MDNGESILETFGDSGRRLKREIALTGFVCRLLFTYAFSPLFLLRIRLARAENRPAIWRRRKLHAIRIARLIFPFKTIGYRLNEDSAKGQIFIINHPTLNDPLCAILFAIITYPDCEIVIPVNLPWFESICRYRQKLLEMGIILVPILTPKTIARLDSTPKIGEIRNTFVSHYTDELTDTLKRGGLAVVAQSATRQRHLFLDETQSKTGTSETGVEILGTVSMMLLAIRRAKITDHANIIPVGVIPHRPDAPAKINPFCKYTLKVGAPISANFLAQVKNPAKKLSADLHLLQRLQALTPSEYHFALEQEPLD